MVHEAVCTSVKRLPPCAHPHCVRSTPYPACLISTAPGMDIWKTSHLSTMRQSGPLHAATAGRLLQAEGESPVTAIHSFPASSSEERQFIAGGSMEQPTWTGGSPGEGPPQDRGPAADHTHGTSTNKRAAADAEGLWESTETRPQEERGAMGLPIQMGIEGAHIKPLSDFEYPKWVQQHISPETAHCPVGPTSWVSESSLYHSLPWHDIHHASSSVISPLLALPRP